MSHANLTARYRPQTFSELAGQETVRAILSRAAAEDKVAPAYLFSGTRGVGKTTVARVFAKALNCVNAPAPEPCNECERCRQITLGTSVDVVEIDGASNRGIDDVRKLKEVVGYAPMEGRYRVFIIDEAHMLSRDAFNALLKTLEEPPSNVTFIMATTEPHKFPATIISRCQHYVFKRLPENGLEAHLVKVLTRENVPFEEGAVRLIARRAAGSVRDAMSLLGQVLALGSEGLTEADARKVLGLAGQELFFSLFATLREGNSASVTKMVGQMLDSGLDLGFFLREMALCWRNMFILRQSGDAGVSVLDIPEKEVERWKQEAAAFDLAHIHAAWQMTVDGQRRVLTSLEPGLALELLLLNIAMLPRLLPLEGLARLGRAAGGNAPAPQTPPSAATPSAANPASPAPQSPPPPVTPPASSADTGGCAQATEPQSGHDLHGGCGNNGLEKGAQEAEHQKTAMPESGAAEVTELRQENAEHSRSVSAPEPPQPLTAFQPPEDLSWSAFLRFCKQQQELSPEFAGMLRTVSGEWKNSVMELTPGSAFCAERLQTAETSSLFAALVTEYYGAGTAIKILPPPKTKSVAELREELRENAAVQLLEKEFKARLIDFGISPGSGAVHQNDDATPIQ